MNIGDIAPNFTLTSSDKQPISLSDYAGKNVVLLFVPAAFTGVCTAEFCSIRDEITDYNNLNAQVLGISVDMPFSLNAWKEKEGYNFPLLSDFNKEVINAYDVRNDAFAFGMVGVAKRAVFVINPEGKIIHKEVTPTPGDMPNLAAIKAILN